MEKTKKHVRIEDVYNKLKKHKTKIEKIIIISILIILAIVVGVNRINISNFNPINGDFQNFNPIRRFLSGQVPYKDFAVYLGSGHLVLLSFFQLIVGNNFTKSLLVTNMVTVLMFELTVFVVSSLVLKNKKQALYMTLTMTLINIIRPKFIIQNLETVFMQALDFGLQPGNSAKLIRIAIAPILVILIYIGYKLIDKIANKKKFANKELVKKIYTAIISGMAILWSNDGGIATYITISFIYFLILIKEYKKDIVSIIKYTIMYIVISLISALLVITIITHGDILSWLKFTMGVSQYQKWYYGAAWAKENISLLSLDKSIFNIIMILIAVYYIYKIFKAKEKNDTFRYAMLAFLVITSVISTYLYQIISGGTSRDMLNLVLLLLIVNYIVIMINNYNKSIRINLLIKKAIIIVAIGAIVSNIGTQIANIKDRSESAIYIEELGGYFTQLGNSIVYAKDKIGDEKVFSTYASALETATNQFQPTGTDYIIHCLGNEQREKYMNIFREGNFKYVDTVDRDNGYRYWIRNSNWFFYRELYKTYKPSFTNEYNIFYEKSEKQENGQTNMQIEKEQIGESSFNIKVKTEDPTYNGIADVKISYNSEFKRSFFKTLDINKYVYVEDITTNKLTNSENVNYNIPEKSDEWFVPITIVNGTGEIKLSTYPVNNTKLEIFDAETVNVYNVMFKYCYVTRNKQMNENIVYVDNTNENRVILENVKAIKIGENVKDIIDYKENESFIELTIDGIANEFSYPNFFEVIK